MAKGISVNFKSYNETIPSLLKLIKLDNELKKYNSIILKPLLSNSSLNNTNIQFLEQVLDYCVNHVNPEAQIFIAEGSEGGDTLNVFDSSGCRKLAEKYSIGLIDLNNAEVENIEDPNFLKFDIIKYPRILRESFVISLPKLSEHEEYEIQGSLANMLGAFPAKYYSGFFSSRKNKIRKWPIKYSIHDILRCKMPNLAIIDASEYGKIIIGSPLESDGFAVKLLNKDAKSVQHLKLIYESFKENEKSEKEENVSDITK